VHFYADFIRIEARLAAADQPCEGHGLWGAKSECSTLAALKGFQLDEACIDALELFSGSFEDGRLQIELFTGNQIHALQTGLQERFEIPLEVLAQNT
jgi:hypothetical protein